LSISLERSDDSVIVTPAQLRAARGLLNMSVSELVARTKLAMNTVRKAEDPRARPVTPANARLLRSTLEAAGVVFIEADAQGVGVRLSDPKHEPLERRRSASAPNTSG
jgi:hypothetical protein